MDPVVQPGRIVFWIRSGIALLCLSATNQAPSARAQDLGLVLVPSPGAYIAGKTGSIWLYYLNQSNDEVSWTYPPALNGTLGAATNTYPVLLTLTNAQPGSILVRPGGFAKQQYQFEVPPALGGDAQLTVSNFTPILVRVEGAATAGSPVEPRALKKAEQAKQRTTGAVIVHYLQGHLTPYEPIYFLLGTYPAAEFQFSLKYKVFTPEGRLNPLGHFYFAYTQTSFWDLLTRDPSFFDTSYKPSAFLLYSNIVDGDRFQLDLQSGAEHESNGRGGLGERSLYTAYLQPTARVEIFDNLEFAVQPRLWTYLSLGANNSDLPDYRGNADLRTSLTFFYRADHENPEDHRIQLANQLRVGDDGRHPGILLDLRVDLPKWAKFNPTLQLQYFTGYGQTLRQYNAYSHGFRAGLCLYY